MPGTQARAAGGEVKAFMAESILSCGGQIVLPPGYLQVGRLLG
jgi:ethanolamine-phosphate phospho-lyase